MTTQNPDFRSTERIWQVALSGALCLVLLTGALGSRNTRAVFMTDGGILTGKAFIANVASTDPVLTGDALKRRIADALTDTLLRSPLPRDTAFVQQAGASGGGSTGAGSAGAGAPGLSALSQPLNVPAPSAQAVAPSAANAGGAPLTSSLNPPVNAPNQPNQPSFGTGAQPASPNTGTQPVQPTPPVSAIPEPATWAMLLSGFLVIGLAQRSTRRRNPLKVRLAG